jgi:ABC-type polysaccharide/polyol phosphate export permease/Flp pilus assembly protein TadD
LSLDRELPPLAIDPDFFSAALQAGEFDDCLDYLRRTEAGGRSHANLNRRLAEALFHRGRREEAVECGRRALARDPSNPEMLYFCGWLFSNCGSHGEAAAAYRGLLERYPDWTDGYRHASGSFAAVGALEDAIEYALEACARGPEDPEAAIHAAELLIRCDRAADAAELLRTTALRSPENPQLLRVLSAAEMLRGAFKAALAAIDAALQLAPETAEYHLHRGHLLGRVGEFAAAEAEFEIAAGLDPTNSDRQLAQIDLYMRQGRMIDATAVAGELLYYRPDDPAAAESVLHLLGERMQTLDGDYVVLHGEIERTTRPFRPLPGFIERLHTQCRVVRALIIRETRTRFGESRLGYGWALVEPILHITLLSVAFSVLMHGQPPIGSHFFLFYYTGLVPYHVFVHTSSGMAHAITSNGALLQLPLVTTFDVIVARGLLEFTTDVIVAAIVLALLNALGVGAVPDDLWGPAAAFLAAALLGCGVGYINAVLTVLWRGWDKIYAQVTRGLYFISGIFYVPAMMPDWAREALTWNPLLHAIDWFRSGFFAGYEPHWLDRSYLALVGVIALLAGVSLERGLRRKLSEPL